MSCNVRNNKRKIISNGFCIVRVFNESIIIDVLFFLLPFYLQTIRRGIARFKKKYIAQDHTKVCVPCLFVYINENIHFWDNF